jgi:hypothetical protein
MKVTNALVTGDELNTFVVARPGMGLSGNKCETVGEIQDNYYINIWLSPWPTLASNRLPLYQWIQQSDAYIANEYYDDYVTGECYFYPNQYETNRTYYIDFTGPMPGAGQVNVLYNDSPQSGQTIYFSAGSTGVSWTTLCGCQNDCLTITSAEILFS